MSSSLKYIVDEKYNKKKLRDYLKNIAKLSGRMIKGAAHSERIKVNGKVKKLNFILSSGDQIEFDVSQNETQDIVPEKMDIDIAYEDEDILVVNKPCNMVVHPTRNYQSGTLANGVLNYFNESGAHCIVRLVSRLDMDTSGLIIIAKNQFAHMELSRCMQSGNLHKYYTAVIHGNINPDEGTIDLPIYRDETSNDIRRIVDERGQRSITKYKVKERFNIGDILELNLKTGRTHQIRVHLSHLGFPIFGDTLYGTEDDSLLIKRQALHASKLIFPHPRTGKIIELHSELPDDIKNLIKAIS